MQGLSVRLEGTFRRGAQPASALAVSTSLAASAAGVMALTLGDGGEQSATLTVRLSAARWLDGLDLDTATSDDVARAVVAAVAGSLTVDAP